MSGAKTAKLTVREVWLDYSGASHRDKVLQNLSAVVRAGPYLWTASDEGRTIECLEPYRRGYRLHRQIPLDTLFDGLPGSDKQDEADIESLDIAHGRLWICGSHCRVRRQVENTGMDRVNSRLRVRKSRRLLGSARLSPVLDNLTGPGDAAPFRGRGSLLRALASNKYLAPYVRLPSKENGLDIEGLAVIGERILLGLRGPLVDSIAIVVELNGAAGLKLSVSSLKLHFLDLDGLGIRDLARTRDGIVILAGPVSSADGPFRLYRWSARKTKSIQHPEPLHQWPAGIDHPEGICAMGNGTKGYLVVYDAGENPDRIDGSRYRADILSEGS